jgi:hypothetical protein
MLLLYTSLLGVPSLSDPEASAALLPFRIQRLSLYLSHPVLIPFRFSHFSCDAIINHGNGGLRFL